MASVAERRFLKELLNLCLNHRFYIEGLGIENWLYLTEIDNEKFLYGILYDKKTNHLCIDTNAQIDYLKHEHYPEAFIWQQEY